MILGEVQQNRGVGREGERVLELEGGCLADDRRAACRRFEQERRERAPDVPGDLDGQTGGAVDRSDQLDRRRLAIRAGDGDRLIREQSPGELQLAEHRHVACQRGRDHRGLARDARTLDDASSGVEEVRAVAARDELDAFEGRRLGGVVGDHRLPASLKRARCGPAGAGEADNEIGASGEGRPHLRIEYW